MAAIQEKAAQLAKDIIKDCVNFGYCEVYECTMTDYITQALTEQDRIARAEVYREIYAWLHYEYKSGRKKSADVVDDVKKFCFEHAKAMEGGEV